MGIIKKVYCDNLISSEPDRSPNRIFIFERGEDGLIGIHFRNLSWKLTKEEMASWKKAFIEAEAKLKDIHF